MMMLTRTPGEMAMSGHHNKLLCILLEDPFGRCARLRALQIRGVVMCNDCWSKLIEGKGGTNGRMFE